MNAILNSLAILDDLGGGLPLHNLDFDWMYLNPSVLLWADSIYVPKRFIKTPPDFRVDVGFEKSNEVLQRSLEQAWDTLVRSDVITSVPITEAIRESAIFSYYAVRNRLTQTASGHLPDIGLSVSAELNCSSPPELLRIAREHYCSNHLDAIASNLVVAQNTNSVWLSSEREENAVRWLYCGGMEPSLTMPRARQSVLDQLSILRLPKCEFIPPVASCGKCGNDGATCFTSTYGVEDWVKGAHSRLNQILELRGSSEVVSLRRLLSDVSNKVNSSTDDIFKFDVHAAAALREAGSVAEKRIKSTLRDISKYCDIAAVYSVPLAMFAATTEPSILGPLATILAGGGTVISLASKLMLETRHSWLSLREINL